MIQFPCHCGFVFKVQEDMAGSMVQCPRCKKLNDIPNLADLPNLNSDGTYTLDQVRKEDSQARLRELNRAFGKQKIDDDGEELDLRPTRRQIRRAGERRPQTDDDGLLPGVPKYDPITGELVMPMDFVPQEAAPVMAIPVAGSSIGYATHDTTSRLTWSRIFIELFMPANLVVMFFVYLAHVFNVLSWTLVAIILYQFIGGNAVILGAIPMLFLILGHYALTVEETGPEGHDELPRPLRYLSWSEDIWWPFCRFMIAAVYAYAPMMVMATQLDHLGIAGVPIVGALWLIGNIIFPAALLTSTTSGILLNLRPDRVLRVIFQSGFSYIFSIVMWTIASSLLMIGTFGMWVVPDALETRIPFIRILGNYLIRIPVLLTGTYFMNYFCWLLGTIWRTSHDLFDWVMHESLIPRRRFTHAQMAAPTNSARALHDRALQAEAARHARRTGM